MEFVMKRVYEEPSDADGFRVLVDRLWPRGIRKADARVDLWAKDLTPSPGLRKWFHEDREGRFGDFSSRYAAELRESGAPESFVKSLPEGTERVTLLFAAKAGAPNHVGILKEALERAAKK
ncbi:MAG: DUF488 family protein [Sutterellaceae bacterium]|nr:DUF488 family protein [Sutterellaceae bacterium]MDD7442491.1 DUF488 family protein [Sutterellaceae bacterium]MDY2867593.1 DUF488 family protein [Mesosutterella sp.]